MQHKFTNRLINETSPYLLQHAHNPVDWYAWGEDALARAKAENKVILVSIGYSACHWCHVMERESFESESVAQLMNDSFINIKIDREERPDLDHIYMDAVQAISGSGGWPLNVFLTPDAKPFFGGTYFPPVKAFNRSSWTDVLLGISTAWKDRSNEIESQAENLTDHLKQSNNFSLKEGSLLINDGEPIISLEQCDLMFSAIMKTADTQWGGFGKAPKFPQTFTIQFLLQYHYFTENEKALQQALLSIDKMLTGGIYDHVGGGLARYSTDNEWLAPHFEKMLYDNALLINILCDAYQITSDKKYEEAIHETILFVTNELLDREGGFYAALDADSEGEEGKYYVWSKDEIEKLLGGDTGLFCEFFDISDEGNWEGKNILRILTPTEDFLKDRDIQTDQFLQMINRCLRKLSEQRETRMKPALDDKIILGWNALMLRAIAKAGVVLQNESYKNLAVNNFDFIADKFKQGAENVELKHTYKNGVANYPAFLDDYAYLIAASIQLYKTSLNDVYLENAYEYCDYVIQHFSDESGLFFYFTNQHQKDVIVRKKEIYDGATPSGNAIMAENLFQLAVIFDKPDWSIRATKMLEILSSQIIKYPGSFGIWASLLLQQKVGMNEIAVIGTDHLAVTSNILLNFIPNLIVMSGATENMKYPLLANKPEVKPVLIYRCKNYACSAPVSDTQLLINEIANTNKITT
jgi:uncharacterized protein